MAEIDLDPSFKYLQANQQRALQGIQMGLEIAGRNQMMEMRRQEFNRQMAVDAVRANLMQAQAERYDQIARNALIESESEKRDAPRFAEFTNAASLYADDTTGTIQAPTMPEFELPRNRIAAANVMRDARLRNVVQKARSKDLDDAIEAGAVDFGPEGIIIDKAKLASARAFKQTQDISRLPMDIENAKAFIEANPGLSESQQAIILGRAKTRGGVGVEKADVTVNELRNIGLVQSQQEEQEAKTQAIQNKLSPSAKITDAISAADQAVIQMRNAFSRIRDFNARYNAKTKSNDAFKEFIGPIDNPTLSAEARFVGVTDLDKKEALSIIQQIQQVILDYRNAKFGATLTTGETAALNEIVGTPKRNDFLLLTESFANNLERGIKTQLGRYKYAPNLIELYKSYQPDRFAKRIDTKEEYDALPSGSIFIDSSGKTKRKQ